MAIVALGIGLRVWNSDLTPFLDDEAGLLYPAKLLIEQHQLPATGGIAMSIHINEPPLIVYLVALPMLISQSPAWVTAVFTCLDGLAVLFVYSAANQLAGRTAAIAAGLAYAVAPAAIYFSRRTDYFALTPFFSSLAMVAAIYAWQRRSPWGLALSLTAAAVSAQVHSSSAMTLATCLIVAGLLWPRLKRRSPLLAALGLIGATLAPYIYLQLHIGWADVSGVLEFLRQPSTLDGAAIQTAATLIGGGTDQQLLLPRNVPPPILVVPATGWLLVALMLCGLVVAAYRRFPGAWIVVMLALLPVLATSKHSTQVLPYYLMPILPAAAVLAGLAISEVPWRVVGAALLGLPLLFQLVSYVQTQQAATDHGPALNYGMPLRYEAQAAQLLNLAAGTRVFVGQEGNQRASFPYLTNYHYTISHFDSRYGLPLTQGARTYLMQAGSEPYQFLEQHAGPPTAMVKTPGGRPMFGLFNLPAGASASLTRELTPVQAGVAGALQIRGYKASALAAGQPSPAILEWAIVDAGASLPPEVQQFLHLVDGMGTTWSTNADERPYPRREWVTGDVCLSWFDLAPRANAPTGGYWLDTGFYGYTGGGSLPVSPGGTSVRLGPVRLAGAPAGASAPPRAIFGDGEIGLTRIEQLGDQIRLTWTALKKPAGDYTVFVHLLDPSGHVIAQHDGVPQDGAFPTSLWEPGDTVVDVHTLPPAVGATAIELGLYRRSLARLPVNAPTEDRLVVPLPVSAP